MSKENRPHPGAEQQEIKETSKKLFDFDSFFSDLYHQVEAAVSGLNNDKQIDSKITAMLTVAKEKIERIIREGTHDSNFIVEINSDDKELYFDQEWILSPILVVCHKTETEVGRRLMSRTPSVKGAGVNIDDTFVGEIIIPKRLGAIRNQKDFDEFIASHKLST